jgi:hypothetical protein
VFYIGSDDGVALNERAEGGGLKVFESNTGLNTDKLAYLKKQNVVELDWVFRRLMNANIKCILSGYKRRGEAG